jgi:hypothetical protein
VVTASAGFDELPLDALIFDYADLIVRNASAMCGMIASIIYDESEFI